MARRIALVAAAYALAFSMIVMGPPQVASATSDCNHSPNANTADVSLVQSATGATVGTTTWTVTYTIVLVNTGPCQISGLTIHDDLLMSTPYTWGMGSTNPGSWTCTTSTSAFDCFLNANVGVNGTVWITFQVTWTSEPKNVSNHAVLGQIPNGDCSVVVCEATGDNNDESWSGATFGNGFIQDGPDQPTTQTHKVGAAGQGISAVISHDPSCGTLTSCLGTLTIDISVNGGNYNDPAHPLTLVFIYTLAESGFKKPFEIVIFHDGIQLSACTRTVPPEGCVKSAKQTTIGGQKYNVITITTPTNGEWNAE